MRESAESRRRRGVPPVVALVLGAAIGAAAALFVVPRRGQLAARVRHGRRQAARELRARTAFARGRAARLAHALRPGEEPELDDVALAHKVESIVFRDPHVPKGRISVNAERGAVYLRGELESEELIHELEDAVRAVRGVHRVENLLHVPGTPAPHPEGGALLGRSRGGHTG